MRLRVEYRRPRDLVTDHDEQFVRGGLLVRVPPPDDLRLYDPVELELASADGTILLSGQVVQMVPGLGIAVAFDRAALAPLAPLVAAARAAGDAPGPAALHARAGGPTAAASTTPPPPAPRPPAPQAAPSQAPPAQASPSQAPPAQAPPPQAPPAPARPAAATAPAGDVGSRLAAATTAEKIQLALHGNRDERAAILRDLNKLLHAYVLKNPNLQLDEVAAMARMTTVSPELLKGIADRREWAGRPEIAFALVRNPKVPVPTALKVVDAVSPGDLRLLAKDPGTRGPIQQAARRKVLR